MEQENILKIKMNRRVLVSLVLIFVSITFSFSNSYVTLGNVIVNHEYQDSFQSFNMDNFQSFDIDEIVMNLPSFLLNREEINFELLSDWTPCIIPGAPQLPARLYRLLLPPNIDLESVRINILNDDIDHIVDDFSVSPAPPPIALLADSVHVAREDDSKNIYFEDRMWPNNIIQSIKIQQLRDANIVEFYYYPVQFNPVQNIARSHENVQISISWKNTEHKQIDPLTLKFLQDYSETINNFEDFSHLYDITLAGIPDSSYVIITTNDIESNSTNLADFVRFKQALGFNVRVITEDEFGVTEGKERALNIRTWLQDNYVSDSIEYVLLIGNPNPEDDQYTSNPYGDIPMLMCWPRYGQAEYNRTPTDYIYADLTGDWDTDDDGYYGEHSDDVGVDFYPEVYVGRIPVYYEDYSSLDTILQNIMDHHINAGAEKTRILEPMAISNYANEDGLGGERTDTLDLPEEVYNNILNPLGMADFVLYENAGINPVLPSAFHYGLPLNDVNVISEFNNGYGAVFWWGHGNDVAVYRKYWANDEGSMVGIPEAGEMVWDTFLHSDNMTLLETDQPAFFYQASCHNGYPEYSDNLGYSLLKRGAAISTVSSTRVSWYLLGNWNHTNWWTVFVDNAGLGYFYMENLLKNGMTAGKALYNAKVSGGDGSYPESWMNKMDFNLYGDPQMDYWGSNQPNVPINPSPADLEDVDSPYCILGVEVSDPDVDQLCVAFYNATDDSLIGIVTEVNSGEEALMAWTILPEGSSHEWYVIIGDGQEIRISPTWSFSIAETSPTWDEIPSNQIIVLGEEFRYDLNASDPSGIDHWWINDTTNFNFDSQGIITNATELLTGDYWLEVRAYDVYNRYCLTTIKVSVVESVISEFSKNPLFIFICSTITLTFATYWKIKNRKRNSRS